MERRVKQTFTLLMSVVWVASSSAFAIDSTSSKPLTMQNLLGDDAQQGDARRGGAHGKQHPHARLSPEMHIQVALQHKAESRMGEAFATLDQAISFHPLSAELLAVRGSFHLERKDISSALRDFEAALVISPDSAAILTNRAQAYRHFGRISEALADLDKAISLNPDLLAAFFNRGAIYYSSGDYARAEKDFDSCIAINPHAAGPYFNRASAKDALGNRQGAIEDISHFMEMAADARWKQVGEELLQKWQDEAQVSKSDDDNTQ